MTSGENWTVGWDRDFSRVSCVDSGGGFGDSGVGGVDRIGPEICRDMFLPGLHPFASAFLSLTTRFFWVELDEELEEVPDFPKELNNFIVLLLRERVEPMSSKEELFVGCAASEVSTSPKTPVESPSSTQPEVGLLVRVLRLVRDEEDESQGEELSWEQFQERRRTKEEGVVGDRLDSPFVEDA